MTTKPVIHPNRTVVRLNLAAHWCLLPLVFAVFWWSKSIFLLLVLVPVAQLLINRLLPTPRTAAPLRLRGTPSQRQLGAVIACIGSLLFLLTSIQAPDIGARIGTFIQGAVVVLAAVLAFFSVRSQISWWRFGMAEDLTPALDTPTDGSPPSA